jgi:hypothetical protein
MFCRLFFDNLDERKRNVVGDVLAWHPKPSGQDAEIDIGGTRFRRHTIIEVLVATSVSQCDMCVLVKQT